MTNIQLKSKQGGSFLIEAIIAMIIMSSFYYYSAMNITSDMHYKISKGTTEEIRSFSQDAAAYMAANGEWPDEANLCVDAFNIMQAAGLINANLDDLSPRRNQYGFSCTPTEFSISVAYKDADYANGAANSLGRSYVTGDVLTKTRGLPGTEPIVEGLVRLDGTNGPMTGDHAFGGYDVSGVGSLGWGTSGELKDDQGGSIDLGDSLSVGTAPYIDFSFGTGAAQDYNVRISNDGDGQLTLDAANTLMTGGAEVDDMVVRSINRSSSQAVYDVRLIDTGDSVDQPNCPAGLSAEVFSSLSSCASGATSEFYSAHDIQPTDNGDGTWSIDVQLNTTSGWITPDAGYCDIQVMTKCT